MKRHWVPLVVLLPLALAGCGSLFQTKAAPPTMYLLSMPKSTAPTAAALPVDLAVLKPRVRGGIDTDRIALLYPDRRLDYYANVRWSGPLDELMQELAVQEFHAVGAVRNISTDASVFASSYWLEIEVVDFQSEYASLDALPTVHVHLLARIGGSSERRVIARFETDARETAAENRLSAIVDAYNRAADKALGDIVAQSTEILKAR